MAFAYSPKIVTDGLVFAVDAANTKSYPGSGTTWKDLSGNGNDGTLTNGPTFDSSYAGGIIYDMSNDYVKVNNSSSITITGSEITYEAVFKTSYTVIDNNGNAIISKRKHWESGDLSFSLWHVQGDYISGSIDTSSGRYNVNSSSLPDINDGKPHIVQVVYDGDMLYMYLDGILTDSIVATGNILNQNVDLIIGNGQAHDGTVQYAYTWNGSIYCVKIYNRALSPSEITQNYNALKGRFGL